MGSWFHRGLRYQRPLLLPHRQSHSTPHQRATPGNWQKVWLRSLYDNNGHHAKQPGESQLLLCFLTHRNMDSLIFLVGNKQDLCHMREVRREEAQCLAAECRCQFYELSAAEHHQEVALIFLKMVQNANVGSKAKERRRRPSGSMAKLINNVFGKRRKSV